MLLVFLSLVLPSCQAEKPALPKAKEAVLSIASPAFRDGERIPGKYTGDGEDISPPLVWGEPPTGTQSLALIVDDPDAPGGVFTHWVLFNIPPDSR